ncbi:MAG: TauD/TfdA family dioxygenase, partial [Pseudomonadota bacterium]|nr:TauD/TfdA family dioxygenase [Pseudomonadota bacterium]
MLTAQRLSPALGAILEAPGFDEAAMPALAEAAYEALMEHQVIFFRGTDISPAAHLAFAQAFGEIDEPHPIYPSVDGFDRIVKLENNSDVPPDTNSWHTDLTYKRVQPFASILVARSIPELGGDTLWSSLYAAYDRLPEGMKSDLAGLEAIHDLG